jgi:hypothetical protein
MEEKAMFINMRNPKRRSIRCFGLVIIAAVMMSAGAYQPALAAEAKQKSFKSPEDAVKALSDAVKANDTKELLAIFGSEGKELVSSGDKVADETGRERFTKAYGEMNKLVNENETKVILRIGKGDWPFPVPIVKRGDSWLFDTMAGREEVLNRRIGRNELNAIQVCLAYVDAQREYILKDRDEDKLAEYAQKLVSRRDQKNGLYWEAKEGEEPSPLGPLFAKAAKEGYIGRRLLGRRNPYHGYHYKILKAQGKNARGGEYDYIVKDKMIGGFALVAYPDEYGNSGVMTFIVNQDGVVYEKDLGKETEKTATAMEKFDPDSTWKKVE